MSYITHADLGGQPGFGPVTPEPEGELFHASWEPRVLADFGTALPETTRIRVWDSTAEVRYLVIPQRPADTEGWSEDELAALVSRDSMIGTRLADSPAAARNAA